MITNLVSIETVIARIKSYLNIQDNTNDDELVEWIADANRFIGVANGFIEHEALLLVCNYKAKFPCDFIQLTRIEDGVCPNDFKLDDYYFINGRLFSRVYDFNILNQYFKKVLKDGFYSERHAFKDASSFRIQHNYIYPAFEKGLLKVRYKGLPIDSNTGFPMVADDESYTQAFMWYVAKWLALRSKLNNGLDFNYCNQQWIKYCLQARGNGNMPDVLQQDEVGFQYNKQPDYL
jgi:hypothetical protein